MVTDPPRTDPLEKVSGWVMPLSFSSGLYSDGRPGVSRLLPDSSYSDWAGSSCLPGLQVRRVHGVFSISLQCEGLHRILAPQWPQAENTSSGSFPLDCERLIWQSCDCSPDPSFGYWFRVNSSLPI